MPQWERRATVLDDIVLAEGEPAPQPLPIQPPTLERLMRGGLLSREAADYLALAMNAGANTLVSGLTGSGKTTLLNALGLQIKAARKRIVTITEANELQLGKVYMALAPRYFAHDNDGGSEVSMRECVQRAGRTRRTRILLDEIRGAEALDMLRVMHAGHGGSICTIHASDASRALMKLRSYAMMAGDLERDAIHDLVRSAIHVVVHLRRARPRNRSTHGQLSLRGHRAK